MRGGLREEKQGGSLLIAIRDRDRDRQITVFSCYSALNLTTVLHYTLL